MSRRYSVLATQVTKALDEAEKKTFRLLLEKAELPIKDMLLWLLEKRQRDCDQYRATAPDTQQVSFHTMAGYNITIEYPIAFLDAERLRWPMVYFGQGDGGREGLYKGLLRWDTFCDNFKLGEPKAHGLRSLGISIHHSKVKELTDGVLTPVYLPSIPNQLTAAVDPIEHPSYSNAGLILRPGLLEHTYPDAVPKLLALQPRMQALHRSLLTTHYLAEFGRRVADYLTTHGVAMAVWPELRKVFKNDAALQKATPTQPTPALKFALNEAGISKGTLNKTLRQVVDLLLQAELMPNIHGSPEDGGYQYQLHVGVVQRRGSTLEDVNLPFLS